MDTDATDAAWHAQELSEREQWERHTRISREYRDWLTEIGVMYEKQSNDSVEVPQERGFSAA